MPGLRKGGIYEPRLARHGESRIKLAALCRATIRGGCPPGDRAGVVGFRLARPP